MRAAGLAAFFICALLRPALADTIYVSNEQDNTISVINSASLTVTTTIDVGHRPRGIAVSRDNTRLYVAAGDDDRIDVVDLKTRKIVGFIDCGQDPEFFAIHPDGKRAFVSNENDNLISVVNLEAKIITEEIPVGV